MQVMMLLEQMLMVLTDRLNDGGIALKTRLYQKHFHCWIMEFGYLWRYELKDQYELKDGEGYYYQSRNTNKDVDICILH